MGTLKVIGSALYQWEIGRKIRVLSSVGDRAVMVQFAHPGDKEALSVTPREENGVIVADVPNILLQSGDKIIAFLVEVDANYVETTRHSVFYVVNRPKPGDYVYTETEVLNYHSLVSRIDQIERNGVSDEQIATAVDKYLEENPVEIGATTEQAAQIQQNKADIETLNREKLDADKLPEAVNDALAQAKASGEFKGDPGDDYVLTAADKQEIAEQAATMVEVPEGGTVTEEQIAEALGNYLKDNPITSGSSIFYSNLSFDYNASSMLNFFNCDKQEIRRNGREVQVGDLIIFGNLSLGIVEELTSTHASGSLYASLKGEPGSGGGGLDATIDGETLVFAESSTATIENETLIL